MTPDRPTPLEPLEDSTLVRQGAVRLLRLVSLATEIAAARDLDELLKTMAEGLTRLLLATRTTIYVYDKRTDEIWSKVSDQLEIREIRLRVGKGIAGKTAQERKLLNVPDAQHSPYFAAEIDRKTGFITRSILCAPMLNLKKELIGVIEVLNKRAGVFGEEDEELLRLFCGYSGVAIEGQLLEEENRGRERLAAVGSMAGTIVHDVKNVLSVVNGYLDMIKPSDRDKDLVHVIQGEIDKIVDLTSEVLEFARGGETKLAPKRVDVDQAVAEVLRVLEREFQFAGVKLAFEPRKAGPAKLDLRRFRRVIMNLAQNARKVLPRGGTFTVRTRRDGKTVHIDLEDDGPGIPPEIRGRIFTPFASAGEHGGTGLGLAIAKSIIEAHNGSIAARDRQPNGTVFEITLPGDDVGSGLHSVASEMPPLGT